MHPPPPLPRSEVELLDRADGLAGAQLSEIAHYYGVVVPPDLRRHKGWIGDLIERALGAMAGGMAGPDLPELGIELKTIPVSEAGKPREATWVCVAPMDRIELGPWERSPVRHKLQRVLWLPIVGDGPPGERRVGAPIIWSPTADQEEVLAGDWATLAELIGSGEVWRWRAHLGKALQIRPKASKSTDYVWVLNREGDWVQTNPLGFYLRSRFTAQVLAMEARLTLG